MGRKKIADRSKTKAGKAMAAKKIKRIDYSKNIVRLLGMKDVMPSDFKILNSIVKKIEETANSYSFSKIETPVVEDFSLYKRFFDKNKIKTLFSLESKGNDKNVLRPDLVHGLIRAFLEHSNLNKVEKPSKFFSLGPVFRQEKVKGGVYRQFNQFNFTIINDPKPVSDAFLIFLIYNIFKELQIDVQVQVNSLGDLDSQKEFLNKFSKFMKEKARRSKLCNDCKKNILKDAALLLDCHEESCLNLRNEMPQIIEFLSEESNSRFYKTMEFLDELEVNYNFNPYLTRDLTYYNDLIFEIWPIDKNGELNSKLSLGRGGRYDNAFSKIWNRDMSMLGFSGGIERTLIKAKESASFIGDKKDVIFLAQIDISAKAKSISLFKELLSKDFNVKQAFHLNSLKDQIEEARSLKSKILLILGKKELNDGTIIFRDIESGVQETIALKDLVSRLEKALS